MAKRMSPYDYFNLSPTGSVAGTTEQKINQAVDRVREQTPEAKIIYVDKPYPVEVPRPIEAGNPNTNYQIPWGLITILGIIGILSVSIVAIVVGRKG